MGFKTNDDNLTTNPPDLLAVVAGVPLEALDAQVLDGDRLLFRVLVHLDVAGHKHLKNNMMTLLVKMRDHILYVYANKSCK